MKEMILVVEDNPDMTAALKLALEMEGYQVLTAADGLEALQILEKVTPDLIVADIMMPRMDGYELYEATHQDEKWLSIPFIFLTAKTGKEDIRLGKEMGADDYLVKPVEKADLIAAIRGKLKRVTELKAAVVGAAQEGHAISLNNRFTLQALDAWRRSVEVLQRYGHSQVDTEHFLLALLEQPGGVVPEILGRIGVDLDLVRERLDEELRRIPRTQIHGGGVG